MGILLGMKYVIYMYIYSYMDPLEHHAQEFDQLVRCLLDAKEATEP